MKALAIFATASLAISCSATPKESKGALGIPAERATCYDVAQLNALTSALRMCDKWDTCKHRPAILAKLKSDLENCK